MASGAEILSLINSSIDIIKLAVEIYGIVKSYKELPKGFDEIDKQLPLAQDTLRHVRKRVASLDAATRDKVMAVMERCDKNIKALEKIFEEIKDTQGKGVKTAYKRVVKTIGKRGRAEDLMQDIVADVKSLAEYQVFQLADQVDALQKAIDDLAEAGPSIPDAEMEEMFGIETAGFQIIGDHGVQFGNDGDAVSAPGGHVNTAGRGSFHQTIHNDKSVPSPPAQTE
ncbi:hypothetical protein F5883DRAFT_439993 [Diaporthe sp. PMI_573]|nr:hypothetical protein F5883DRAFT_439993 [Diaporthaceae sp. PMI_573]